MDNHVAGVIDNPVVAVCRAVAEGAIGRVEDPSCGVGLL